MIGDDGFELNPTATFADVAEQISINEALNRSIKELSIQVVRQRRLWLGLALIFIIAAMLCILLTSKQILPYFLSPYRSVTVLGVAAVGFAALTASAISRCLILFGAEAELRSAQAMNCDAIVEAQRV